MPADRDPTEPIRALATFRSEAGACTHCHARGWLHVEDGQTAAPLFHLEATGRTPILCVMEAPNRDDTFDPTRGRLTVGGETDPTGRFLEELLAHVGLRPEDVVCTNAVLCLPRHDGRRYTVTPELRDACRPWLERLIALLDPRVVVTFGAEPLAAVSRIERHGLALKRDAGRLHGWHGRQLLPLYHPGALGRIRRSGDQQRRDIEALQAVL